MGLDDWQYIYFIALQYEKLVDKLEDSIRISDLYNAGIDLDEQLGYRNKLKEMIHNKE